MRASVRKCAIEKQIMTADSRQASIQPDVQQTLERAHAICVANGTRLTEKRRRVLRVVLESAEPLSAYQIADQYRDQNGETLSVMSVYRMLRFLMESDLVHRLETTNQYLPCSHITCHHQHEVPQFLICDSCRTVNEVGIRREILQELRANIEQTGFSMAEQQLELHGICRACQ